MKTMILAVMILMSAFWAEVNAQVDVEYQSYLAHIAAASSAIRLNETGEARRWIESAPAKHRGWEWNYLDAETRQYSSSRIIHEGPINAIKISPDGKFLASASTDRKVKVTDAAGGNEVFSFTDAKLSPQSVAFSPDGKLLAAGFSRHLIIVWDIMSKAEIRRFQGQGKGITAATFSPDGKLLASCSWNVSEARGVWGIVEVWDAATGASVKQLEYGIKPLVAIAFSPDGKQLAVASWEVDKIAAVWETTRWGEPMVMQTEGDEVYKAGQAIAFSPDGKWLAAGGKDNAVRIWDPATGRMVRKLGGAGRGHAKWVNGVAFTPDSMNIVSASTDQSLKVWDVLLVPNSQRFMATQKASTQLPSAQTERLSTQPRVIRALRRGDFLRPTQNTTYGPTMAVLMVLPSAATVRRLRQRLGLGSFVCGMSQPEPRSPFGRLTVSQQTP
jgi:WD40 repeat protein